MQHHPAAANSNGPSSIAASQIAHIYVGKCLDVLKSMPSNSVDLCVTSPPYYGNLRDYGHPDQYGREPTLESYLRNQVNVFHEVQRILKPSGNLWINIGDKYDNGNLIGVPWHLAFELKADGWILREEVIWSKPNPTPESVRDRTVRSHEYWFHFVKAPNPFFDYEAIMVQGHDHMVRKRSVWEVPVRPHDSRIFKHNAMYPEALIEPIIVSSCPQGGTVLDPFGGAGTSCLVANRFGRKGRMIELNPKFADTAKHRLEAANSNVRLVETNPLQAA